MDYYDILGVDKDASVTIIKRAYKTQVLTCHPDKVSPCERVSAEEKFKLLTEAYQVLCDPIKRAEYDSSKRVKRNIGTQGNMFDDFFSQRELFQDPFSHPFFSQDSFSDHFSYSFSDRLSNHLSNPFSLRSPFMAPDNFFGVRGAEIGSSSVHRSSVSQNGITKTVTETKSGNTITREEVISENGHVISKSKTVTQNPRFDDSKSFKIHIS